MKRKFFHPNPTERELSGPQYWKSLDEVADTPAFREWLHQEFPSGASELEGVNRRQFLKLMGASFAFAGVGLSGCRQPEQYILPYAKQPERLIPGVPVFYTTSQPRCRENIPLIVETHESRPTKVEGNSSYLPYGGATDAFAQASILDLYDPDRVQYSIDAKHQKMTRPQVLDLLADVKAKYMGSQGRGLAFLAEPSTSVSRQRMVAELKKMYPYALWSEYAPLADSNTEKTFEGLFGKKISVQYHFEHAERILALESNFLQNEAGSIGYMKAFATKRKPQNADQADSMNRLYAVESVLSITGGMADHHLTLNYQLLSNFAAKVLLSLLESVGAPADEIAFYRKKVADVAFKAGWIEACVADLLSYRGKSLVVAGKEAPEAVHTMVYRMNEILGGVGQTFDYVELPVNNAISIGTLTDAVKKSQVTTLVILEGNPVYNAPANLQWNILQKTIPQVIRYGYHWDETSELGVTHIAANHYLESWEDGRTADGTYVPVQPMIMPLFEGFSWLEFVGHFLEEAWQDAYEVVKDTFLIVAKSIGSKISFENWLAEGLLEKTAYAPVVLKTSPQQLSTHINRQKFESIVLNEDSLEVRILGSQQVENGRYANNGWLQECPESLTKLTWDNVIAVGPKLAKILQKKHGIQLIPDLSFLNEKGQSQPDFNHFKQGKEEAVMAELTIGDQVLKGPIHVQPGLAEFTVALTLGYGRSCVGHVGNGVGFNVYPVRTEEHLYYCSGVQLKLLPETYKLANVQQHWSMEGRAIIREANAQEYKEHPDFTKHMCLESHTPPNLGPDQTMPFSQVVRNTPRGNSAYETPNFKAEQQWGMVIDLSTCTGCNACVLACQSENNVPIVGKEQVARGREMHWLRLDRYFSSGHMNGELPEDPQVAFMGMMCQHCELAPCETVCPVNATVHDDQGLNVMAYNRCVGTRYCANNCPYKVRRFNFFDWNKRQIGHFYEGPLGPSGMPELHKMQKNPNVSVRMRGVMEKCTYCVQRIESAKIRQLSIAKDSPQIKVADGLIKTACQQVCPSGAIVFGDVADENTAVSQARASDRAYAVLGYLNIRPRTMYLSRLRNPNPEMPDYVHQPLSRVEYNHRSGHH